MPLPPWPALLAIAAVELAAIGTGVALVPSDSGDLVVIGLAALAGGEAIRRAGRRARRSARRQRP